MILGNLLGDVSVALTKTVSGDYTLEAGYSRIEVTLSANTTLTLPTITDSFKSTHDVTIKVVSDNLYSLTIVGTGGNYEDDGIVLFGLEGTTIYASDAGIWRSAV
jgi:hypothetical protein